MRSRLIVLLATALAIFVALPAWSDGNTGLREILVFSGTQYLGDPPRVDSVEYLVHLRRGHIRRANYAALEFKSAGVYGGSRVIVNGREYQIPISEGTMFETRLPSYANTVVPIPVGILQRNNIITFEAYNPFPGTNTADDFAIADVYLILN